MALKFTEYPVYVSSESYQQAIGLMAERLMQTGKVKCVYQVGGVSSPGISDLDLFVVFNKGANYSENPVTGLEFPANYLYSHKLFGTSEELAPEMERFTFFGKYNLIAGAPVDMFKFKMGAGEIQTLKSQIALEYLVKAWIAASTAIAFKTIKLRSFLLHAKAVQYDIDFLEIKSPELTACIDKVIDIRSSWFNNKPGEAALTALIYEYCNALSDAIITSINKHHFYIPAEANKQIAGRIRLENSINIAVKRSGVILPSLLTSNSKLLFKINNRLNRFTVEIPIKQDHIPAIIQERFNSIKNAFEYNKINLPNFICTGHGLNIFSNS